MKRLFSTLTVLVAILMVCGTAFAASSKVTADCEGINALIMDPTTQTNSWDTILKNTIHTANWSDLNVDVSLECGLLTKTLVRSKGGNKDTSVADASVKIKVLLDGNVVALPGEVTFCKRTQELSAVFQGLLDGCLYIDPETGAIKIDEECLLPEELELVLDTMNANSFNFIIPDVSSGTHTIEVQAEIKTSTSVQAGEAEALGFLGKGTVAVDEVRYIKDHQF